MMTGEVGMRFLLGAVLMVCACSVPAWADLSRTIIRVKPSIVAVGTQQALRSPVNLFRGTGFVVGDGLSVVTNAHVVPRVVDDENKEQLIVLSYAGQKAQIRPAKIAMLDTDHDLVVLRIGGPPLPALTLGDSSIVQEGDAIAFTGFPLGMALGLHPVTHRGTISAITPVATKVTDARDLSAKSIERLRNAYPIFQLDATAYPGNSGSPFYDPETGIVYGVINSVFVKETKEAVIKDPSGITYAIPSNFIRDLLADIASQASQ
jgi:serine protease Do